MKRTPNSSLLLRAAARVRETAASTYPGPRVAVNCDGHGRGSIATHEPHVEIRVDEGPEVGAECGPLIADTQDGVTGHLDRNAPHLVLWQPETALLVAVWLEVVADHLARDADRIVDEQDTVRAAEFEPAIALARRITATS